jgi:hypothetical protein
MRKPTIRKKQPARKKKLHSISTLNITPPVKKVIMILYKNVKISHLSISHPVYDKGSFLIVRIFDNKFV